MPKQYVNLYVPSSCDNSSLRRIIAAVDLDSPTGASHLSPVSTGGSRFGMDDEPPEAKSDTESI
jgi:hypothetical protein